MKLQPITSFFYTYPLPLSHLASEYSPPNMDSPADWAASALFSPSKARAQQAQAKDWAFVDAWLAKRYGKAFPNFERNEETLQALLSLVTVNEGADEQRALIERVEKAALQAGARRTEDTDSIYEAVLAALPSHGHASLKALAESGALLGTTDVSRMALAVCDLTTQDLEYGERCNRARDQESSLQREQVRLRALLNELGRDDFQAPAELPEQTGEWMRNARQLKAKLAEYDERLSALRTSTTASPSLESVSQQMKDLEAQQQRLSELNANLSAFDSLPSDPKAARAKMEAATAQLRNLTQRRDELFEGLAS
jgi:HAUS augmin-like complex subunit 1